jgi:hypothetical protein
VTTRLKAFQKKPALYDCIGRLTRPMSKLLNKRLQRHETVVCGEHVCAARLCRCGEAERQGQVNAPQLYDSRPRPQKLSGVRLLPSFFRYQNNSPNFITSFGYTSILAMFGFILQSVVASLPFFCHCPPPATYGIGFHLSFDYA